VGGRGTIIGAFVGTFLVNGAAFFLSGVLADFWQLIMGGLFVFVVLVMRDGIVGTLAKWLARRRTGSIAQMIQESDEVAADRQRDFRGGGGGKLPEEI
jgi:ABC-type branched-subunit amino acid transport system permease subunit